MRPGVLGREFALGQMRQGEYLHLYQASGDGTRSWFCGTDQDN